LGSHRVCTINFVRIALEVKRDLKDIFGAENRKEYFFNILSSRIENTIKILKSHKELLKDLIDKGLQPFFNYGWLNLNRMFSTVGIIGVYEAAKILKELQIEGDIEKDILIFLNKNVSELSKKYGIFSNIEQIPAESFAVRFAEADRILFGKENQPYELYSNQFIPLWEEATIWERLDKDGMYNKLITGGGIVHAQIGEKVTPKQAEKIIKYAINAGAEHFALNSIYSECENGHCLFGKTEICKECGGKIVEQYSRVVGFFVPVSSWNKVRRDWEFGRRKFVSLE
jgi:ribonucleoside-triphosphate reductase